MTKVQEACKIAKNLKFILWEYFYLNDINCLFYIPIDAKSEFFGFKKFKDVFDSNFNFRQDKRINFIGKNWSLMPESVNFAIRSNKKCFLVKSIYFPKSSI